MRVLACLALSSLLLAASPALAAGPEAPSDRVKRDARESAPEALMGVWRADIAASTYAGTPPKEHFRTFQYTADGRVLVSFITLGADGRSSSGHWSVRLDGDPGYEFFAANGATPYAEIRFVQVDPLTFNLTNSYRGVVASNATYRLAEDGTTLTVERTPEGGALTRIVYRRWGQ
ncbi:hypothetical protein [Brevundimonas sp.]|jgi:hypothetical protein|uniref:hypothetical protein n=1 Tax=Brevundimonas sp. TaxID=1871086 RepID=UPI0037BFCE11